MNDNNNEFHDPLDDVIARATGMFTDDKMDSQPNEESITKEVEVKHVPNDTFDDIDIDDDTDINVDDPDDDPYGAYDADREIEQEDILREEERQRAIAEAQRVKDEQVTVTLPPQSLDKKYQAEAIGFQENNLAIVTGMVERVKAKYHLKGGIKEEVLPIVMGDLMEEYYVNGEEVTPRFEQIILDNWTHVANDGSEYSKNDQTDDVETVDHTPVNTGEPAEININVAPDQPVTVNVDDDIVNEITKTRVININVREVTNLDMERVTVIENTQKEGVIRNFDVGMGYTPVTLPLSAYRCMIRPLNFFEMINMLSPDSSSKVDYHLKRWKVIYEHIKNPSIGDFENFEDFLKKTKYSDINILEWGILAATSGDDEQLGVVCGNPKCKHEFFHTYSPRTIIHPNPDRLPKEYNQIGTLSGAPAIEIYNKISSKRKRYKLPVSGVIIEIHEPSAHEYLTEKLPTVIAKYAERVPEDPNMDNFNENTLTSGDPRLGEFATKMALMLKISAVIVPPREDENYQTPHEYRFTNWEDIDAQISMLPMEDTIAILKLISLQEEASSSVDFYVSNVVCPQCGREEPRIVVTNLIQNLLIRVSRRLQNTEINLTELD